VTSFAFQTAGNLQDFFYLCVMFEGHDHAYV
jgi:hypothetical protein